MRKVKAESDLNKKALAVKEMSLHTLNLGTHISRFARIAWILDMLFIFLAILIFSVVLILGAAKDFLPPGIWQMLDSSLDVDFKGFLFFLLGLVAVPIVFDVILSVVCEHSSVTVEKTADGATAQAPEKSGEWHDEDEWWEIVHNINSIDNAKLSREGRDMYDDVEKQLIDKAKSAHVVVSAPDVARRLGGGGSGSGAGSMNDDLDAARRAASITKEYGPGWRGYDAEAPIQDTEALGADPESFPDSNDIW